MRRRRIRWRRERDYDDHPRITARKGHRDRGHRPDPGAGSHQNNAVDSVGQTPAVQADQGIDDAECAAGQGARLGVAQMQIGRDGLRQDPENLAVEINAGVQPARAAEDGCSLLVQRGLFDLFLDRYITDGTRSRDLQARWT